MIRALSDAEIQQLAARGAAELRVQRAASAPKTVNTDEALALGQPIPLLWSGVRYTIRPISYREGLTLQRAAVLTEEAAKNPPKTVEEIEDAEAELIQTLALMHSLLEDAPEVNPFADASPSEVGALLGFYCACLTLQRGHSRLGMRPASMM
jgi:hypothetical protein